MKLLSAGSSLVEVLLGSASSPQPSALASGVPETLWGFESTRKGPE